MTRTRERGVTLVEVVVYTGLLGLLTLCFYSAMSSILGAERHAVESGTAQDEADRVYELVSSELRSASLATLAIVAGARGPEASFRRITGIEVDAVSGLPYPVVEDAPATLRRDRGGLVREQAGATVILSPHVTELGLERVAGTEAVAVRVRVERPGAERGPDGAPLAVIAIVEGRVIVEND